MGMPFLCVCTDLVLFTHVCIISRNTEHGDSLSMRMQRFGSIWLFTHACIFVYTENGDSPSMHMYRFVSVYTCMYNICVHKKCKIPFYGIANAHCYNSCCAKRMRKYDISASKHSHNSDHTSLEHITQSCKSATLETRRAHIFGAA